MEHLSFDIVGGEDLESWRLIAEQLEFKEMPLDKKDVKPLPQKEREALLRWIQGEMLKLQSPMGRGCCAAAEQTGPLRPVLAARLEPKWTRQTI